MGSSTAAGHSEGVRVVSEYKAIDFRKTFNIFPWRKCVSGRHIPMFSTAYVKREERIEHGLGHHDMRTEVTLTWMSPEEHTFRILKEKL